MSKPIPSNAAKASNVDRNSHGQFIEGNRQGHGNPLAGRAAKIRAVLLQKLTEADVAQIADRLIAMAKDGDLAAMKELFDRTIGKPAHAEIYERLEQIESELMEDANEKQTTCD